MKLPLEVFFHGMSHSHAIESAVRRHATKLDEFCSDIMRCRVSVILDEKRKRRGQIKHHEELLHGIVVHLDREQGYGFIRAADENDYYFGPDNLAGIAFEHLEIGTRVHFIAEMANEGHQAKRISKDAH